MKKKIIARYTAPGLVAIGICVVTGCATPDTASSRFPLLEENINAAKAVDAGVYAPVPLKSAESKLASAKSAVVIGDIDAANRFADEAMVDAEYAQALAPTEKAKSEAVKMRETIQAVRDEIKKLPVVH
ncbi:MAG: DUF4398 domain-containing protein [Desulfuromonadaceae bacterium]|nr:DUF4398 domain-containing protein [Desulfuromonadaceae bacterium]